MTEAENRMGVARGIVFTMEHKGTSIGALTRKVKSEDSRGGQAEEQDSDTGRCSAKFCVLRPTRRSGERRPERGVGGRRERGRRAGSGGWVFYLAECEKGRDIVLVGNARREGVDSAETAEPHPKIAVVHNQLGVFPVEDEPLAASSPHPRVNDIFHLGGHPLLGHNALQAT